MSSILLITGGEAFAREVFREEGRADWAQAFPLVLEKHGYLGFDVAGQDALEDPGTWRRYAVVLVARLPPAAWTDPALALLKKGPAQVLIELPPAPIEEQFGIVASEASRSGVVSPIDPRLRDRVAERANVLSARIQEPLRRDVDRQQGMDWTELPVPITTAQARAWRAPGWDARRWEGPSRAETLAEWVDTEGSGDRWPAIIRRGRITAASFSLLGFLGQQTTVEPFNGPEYLNWHRSTALEFLLCALIDDMHRDAGWVRARVMPWPRGARWVLNVRHDFDRQLPPKRIGELLAAHRGAGTAATWYWRARHVDGANGNARRGIRAVANAAAGHEVAHHTEQLWSASAEEQRAIEVASGKRMHGTSAHGDPACFRWQGAPNVMWAARQGLDYTEFISHAHLHPHRFAALAEDGVVQPFDVVCLPHHESLDRSTTPGDVNADGVARAAEAYVKSGGLMQILNHPDINVEALFELVDRLPRDGRLDWTAGEAARWWKRTHVRDVFRLEHVGRQGVRVTASSTLRGVVIELLQPDGTRQRYALDLESGSPVDVGEVRIEEDGGGPWGPSIREAFAEVVREYYVAQGNAPDAPSVLSSVRTNSVLVPERAETIMRYLHELTGLRSLAGARVLEVGSGFGAFAAYLAQAERPSLLTAVDMREDFVTGARRVAGEAEIPGLAYQVDDMRTLSTLTDGTFDVVIVNNAFIYIPDREGMRSATAALARVTAPGGRIVIAHANRWRLREPFTGSPLVHLMPASLAETVAKPTGWKHNHGRVRLISARSLARLLRHAGFERLRVAASRHGRITSPPRAYVAKYYAVAGRRQA